MKRFYRWLSDLFEADEFGELNMALIGEALNDSSVRTLWLNECLEEIRRIHFEVDRRLLSGTKADLTDLCARRKAYQDVLTAVLSARRQVTQGIRPNPRVEAVVNLDRVTA